MDRLIEKVMRDAEENRRAILNRARTEMEALWTQRKKEMETAAARERDKQCEEISRRVRTEEVLFRMSRQQDILSLRNEALEKITAGLEKEYRSHFRGSAYDLADRLLEGTQGQEAVLHIPTDIEFPEDRMASRGIRIVRDPSLRDGIRVETASWEAVLDWTCIREMFRDRIVQEVARRIPGILETTEEPPASPPEKAARQAAAPVRETSRQPVPGVVPAAEGPRRPVRKAPPENRPEPHPPAAAPKGQKPRDEGPGLPF